MNERNLDSSVFSNRSSQHPGQHEVKFNTKCTEFHRSEYTNCTKMAAEIFQKAAKTFE